MSRSRAAGDRIVARQGPVDRWISRAAAGTVAGLASLAGAISYSHMRQLAQQHGQAGWHAQALPLSVDGLEFVASLVLLADRRRGRRSGWLPWAALITGTAGSLAANIASAHPDPVSRIIAGWPAFALLISVKLLSGILEHREADGGPATVPAEPPAVAGHDDARGDPKLAIRPQVHVPPSESGDRRVHSGQPTRPAEARPSLPPTRPSVVPRLDPGAAALLPAARAAKDELKRDGLPLTRDSLAARIRQRGHPIRNASVTPLLQLLKARGGPRHATTDARQARSQPACPQTPTGAAAPPEHPNACPVGPRRTTRSPAAESAVEQRRPALHHPRTGGGPPQKARCIAARR